MHSRFSSHLYTACLWINRKIRKDFWRNLLLWLLQGRLKIHCCFFDTQCWKDSQNFLYRLVFPRLVNFDYLTPQKSSCVPAAEPTSVEPWGWVWRKCAAWGHYFAYFLADCRSITAQPFDPKSLNFRFGPLFAAITPLKGGSQNYLR